MISGRYHHQSTTSIYGIVKRSSLLVFMRLTGIRVTAIHS